VSAADAVAGEEGRVADPAGLQRPLHVGGAAAAVPVAAGAGRWYGGRQLVAVRGVHPLVQAGPRHAVAVHLKHRTPQASITRTTIAPPKLQT